MSRTELKLNDLGIVLRDIPAPIANYLPAKKIANLIYTAGQVSMHDGIVCKGKLGLDIGLETSKIATRYCAINCLAAIRSICPLDDIKSVVAIHGLINSTPDNTQQAEAMNGASDFMVQVFGDAGKHTRTAVGVAVPHNFAASVYMIVEVA